MDNKMKILNYDELPQRGRFIDWKNVEKGFIIRTNHINYGYNNFEFINYYKNYLYLKHDDNCKQISVGNFLKGRIGSLIESLNTYETENFKILTKLPMNKNEILWGNIKNKTIIKTEHINYGYNEFELLKYYKGYLYFKHNDIECTPILANSFKLGTIGKMLGVITGSFKVEIGTLFKDDKRDLVITDREYIKSKRGQYKKYYKYKCNKCGFDCGEHYKNGEYNNSFFIEEHHLLSGNGCACCCNPPQIVVSHINSIKAKTPWMCDLGVSEKDAKRYTPQSHKKIEVTCPDCGNKKEVKFEHIYKCKSIGCTCNIGEYPEKFMYYILKNLNIDFKTEYSPKWVNRRFYDFYIPNYNMIIETHGKQHYEQSVRGRTLQEEQENDKLKRELALENGIKHYIVIDCRYSDMDFIKNNILNSKLNELFDLSQVDWLKCEEFALKFNLVKEVCEYWNQKEYWETTGTIADKFGLNRTSIINYLKRGAKLEWCDYDPKEEMRKSWKSKSVEIFKDGVSLGVFESIAELSRQSQEKFKVSLTKTRISAVCLGKQKVYKGFTFIYK